MGGTINDDPTVYNVNHVGGNGNRISSYLIGPLSMLVLFLFSGCANLPENMPDYKPRLYAGDSANVGISRKQSGELIRANDPKFDEFVAMRYENLSCLYETYIQNCERFKQQSVQCTPITTDQKKAIKKFVKSSF